MDLAANFSMKVIPPKIRKAMSELIAVITAKPPKTVVMVLDLKPRFPTRIAPKQNALQSLEY